ncbi:MAG: hypothetical protein ACM3JP_00530 [Betaproteobacteria bacterium]
MNDVRRSTGDMGNLLGRFLQERRRRITVAESGCRRGAPVVPRR